MSVFRTVDRSVLGVESLTRGIAIFYSWGRFFAVGRDVWWRSVHGARVRAGAMLRVQEQEQKVVLRAREPELSAERKHARVSMARVSMARVSMARVSMARTSDANARDARVRDATASDANARVADACLRCMFSRLEVRLRPSLRHHRHSRRGFCGIASPLRREDARRRRLRLGHP